MSTVNICGIPHKVILVEDNFSSDNLHLGEILYGQCLIKINKALPEPMRYEALSHEIIHGILLHLGYNEQTEDEQFVQSLANAVNQAFIPKVVGEDNDEIQETEVEEADDNNN